MSSVPRPKVSLLHLVRLFLRERRGQDASRNTDECIFRRLRAWLDWWKFSPVSWLAPILSLLPTTKRLILRYCYLRNVDSSLKWNSFQIHVDRWNYGGNKWFLFPIWTLLFTSVLPMLRYLANFSSPHPSSGIRVIQSYNTSRRNDNSKSLHRWKCTFSSSLSDVKIIVSVSIWTMLRDPRYFSQSHEFILERWMEGDQNVLKRSGYLSPWGNGIVLENRIIL